MQVDIVGRVNNLQLPVTQPYIPLFECLVNSIESIEDAGNTDGRIDVHIDRDLRQGIVPGSEETVHAPIRDITILDNGVGFDDVNSRAFFMSDSTRKASRGNKGIGRFTWLKVFEKAHIESTYPEGETWLTRNFDFVKTTEGVEKDEVNDAKSQGRRTSVKLIGLRSEYQKHFPKSLETIGHKIIDHLLIHFVSGSCPQIWLHDNVGPALNLNQVFSDEAKERAVEVEFAIREQTFKAIILRYQSSSVKTHTVSYCANQREVLEWKAGSAVPDMKAKLTDESGQQFVFRTYISGKYLDSRVNSERTNFLFIQEEDLDFPDEMTRVELDNSVVATLKSIADRT